MGRLRVVVAVGYWPKNSGSYNFTMPEADRPQISGVNSGIGVPALMVSNGKCYQGYMPIGSDGVIKGYYYQYAGDLLESNTNAHLYWATLVYFHN